MANPSTLNKPSDLETSRQLAAQHYNKWMKLVNLFPELLNVHSEEDFQDQLQKNPDIPTDAFQELIEYKKHLSKITQLQQQGESKSDETQKDQTNQKKSLPENNRDPIESIDWNNTDALLSATDTSVNTGESAEQSKIYNDPKQDPEVIALEEELLNKADADPQISSAQEVDRNTETWKNIYLRESIRAWDLFTLRYPEKAKAYADKGHLYLQRALERREKAQQNFTEANSAEKDQSMPSKKFADNNTFLLYVNDPEHGLHARVMGSVSSPVDSSSEEYQKIKKVVLSKMLKEFAVRNPEIWVRYHPEHAKILADKLKYDGLVTTNNGFDPAKPNENLASLPPQTPEDISSNQDQGATSDMSDESKDVEDEDNYYPVFQSPPPPTPETADTQEDSQSDPLENIKNLDKLRKRIQKQRQARAQRPRFESHFYQRGNNRNKMASRLSARGATSVGRFARAAKFGARVVNRGATFARTAVLVANPESLLAVVIIIGILILLIIILFVILLLTGKLDGFTSNIYNKEEVPPITAGPGDIQNPNITLNKTAPVSVANGEDITYHISVAYTGNGTVNVYDIIPENTTLVEASGAHTVGTDEATGRRRVHWLLASTSDGNTSEAQNNTSSTIHDLGFGPSDGARIDAMIQRLRPNSPMNGQGNFIVNLANEYNVDPLMIVLTLNESQMCTDNGVVSPGGSNPDNYNCGGILWNTVTGTNGVDVNRWSIEPGPEANGHIFAYVPTIQDGLGLLFNYIGVSSLYAGKSLEDFYDIYNPCDDPGNQGRFACGAEEARNMLELLAQYTGVAAPNPSGGGSTSSSFSLTVRPTADDIYVENQAWAEEPGGGNRPVAGDGIIDVGSNTLEQFFAESAAFSDVPLAMVMAISKVETGGYITQLTDQDVGLLQSPNWWVGKLDNAPDVDDNDPLIIKGYGYNTCQYLSCFAGADVRGIMQFEIQTWNGYKTQMSFSDGHDPDRRYPRDIIFAAGLYLKNFGARYDNIYGGAHSSTDWHEDKVRRVATSYCTGQLDGPQNDPACTQGGQTYASLAWGYYQEYKAMGL